MLKNDGEMLVDYGEMLINDGEWVFDPTLISPSLTSILVAFAWSTPSFFTHLTIIEKLHRLIRWTNKYITEFAYFQFKDQENLIQGSLTRK